MNITTGQPGDTGWLSCVVFLWAISDGRQRFVSLAVEQIMGFLYMTCVIAIKKPLISQGLLAFPALGRVILWWR